MPAKAPLAAARLSILPLLLLLSAQPKPAASFPSYRYKIPNGNRVPCPPPAGGSAGATTLGTTGFGCDVGAADEGEPPSVCRGVGHATCAGGTMPLNPFGLAWKAAGFRWTRALCLEDSDGDGHTNGAELGDPCCEWTAERTAGDAAEALHLRLAQANVSHPGFARATPPASALSASASPSPTCAAAGEVGATLSMPSFFLPSEAAAARHTKDFRIGKRRMRTAYDLRSGSVPPPPPFPRDAGVSHTATYALVCPLLAPFRFSH